MPSKLLDMQALHRNEVTHEIEGEYSQDNIVLNRTSAKNSPMHMSPVAGPAESSPKRALYLDSSPDVSPNRGGNKLASSMKRSRMDHIGRPRGSQSNSDGGSVGGTTARGGFMSPGASPGKNTAQGSKRVKF